MPVSRTWSRTADPAWAEPASVIVPPAGVCRIALSTSDPNIWLKLGLPVAVPVFLLGLLLGTPAIAADATAIRDAAAQIDDARLTVRHARFAAMAQELAALGVTQVHGVLLDLGVSSPQIDNPARGFSFRFDGPLDMRMDPTRGESAAQFLARADERQIAEVIRDYGEERFAVPIAKALVARREGGNAVRTTTELSEVVARAVKTREPGQDPATRTFQALRIFVNAELEALEQGLNAALALLAPGGRLVVISFHSLEDRIVKRFMRSASREDPAWAGMPELPAAARPRLKLVGRAVFADEAEVARNPRERAGEVPDELTRDGIGEVVAAFGGVLTWMGPRTSADSASYTRRSSEISGVISPSVRGPRRRGSGSGSTSRSWWRTTPS